MPTATKELRDKMHARFGGISDTPVILWLQSQGFTYNKDWLWTHPTKTWIDVTDEEEDAIIFLCDEWDWAGFDS